MRNNAVARTALHQARTNAVARSAVNYPKELSTTSYFGSANLKAYYRFINGAETTDSTANANTLTAIGVPVQATPRWGTGCVGLGTSQAFSAVDGADFKPAGNFSVSAWVKTKKDAVQFIAQSFSKNTAAAGFNVYIDSGTGFIIFTSGKNTGTVQGTDFQIVSSGIDTRDGNWHFVVGTWDGAKLHLYQDGSEIGTGVVWANAPSYSATNYVIVGCGNYTGSNTFFHNGLLDEVSFFPSNALSLAQVQSLYAKSITDASNSAIKALASAVYLFNDGGQLVDSSTGAENTLTAIGTPTTCTSKFGGSVFLGNSSAYSVVDADVLKPTGVFSVGGWIKTAYLTTQQTIFQSYSANTNIAGFTFALTAGGAKIRLLSAKNTGTTNNTDYKLLDGNTALNDNIWHFVVGTYDGTNLNVYVDGVSNATAIASFAPVYAATNYVRVGAGNVTGANTVYFFGQLDDIFLLNGTALSADDVNYIYKQRKPIV